MAVTPAALAVLLTVVGHRTIAPSSFIPVPQPQAIVSPLALVVEEGSGWDEPGRLEAVLGRASAIFGQCRVALGAAEVITVRWSPEGLRRLNNSNPYDGPAQMAVMDEPLIPARRPVGFLFGPKSVPSTAEAYNGSSVNAFKVRYPDAAKLLNTFWFTYDEFARPPRKDESASYSTFAHELTHLFGDVGHTRASPNLMTDAEGPGAKSGDLLPEQCAEIRKLHDLP
jgi:hypothetical protein